MTERTWTVDEANAALPRVAALVERARQAVERMRRDADATRRAAPHNGHGERGNGQGRGQSASERLEATILDLENDGIVLRDVDRGLIDFPAVSPSGRAYWLCWVVGEPAVEWWHWPEDGFAGRTPLDEPPL